MAGRELEAGTGLASYQSPLEGGRIRCELCPHRCSLPEGGTGLCKVRRNLGGRLVLPYWGVISALALDPIEKKPLHHFKPGTAVFSAGFYGCNLRCPFCQNWEISQEVETAKVVTPAALVDAALESGAPSLAFTYSEPTVHFEYLLEAARLARKAGLATVLVTNGCLNEAPARELLPLIDAANVDLKTWSEAVYREKLGGDRASVLRFIELAAQTCELEVTTLVVPGISEGEEDMEKIASFLAGLDRRIPLHLSAYHPDYRYREPPSPPELLLRLADRARKSLDYVYVGNLGGIPADTFCSACGALLVRRRGYQIDASGLAAPCADKKAGNLARCKACGAETSIWL
jgi:pyruvate formate lyase activating enzyme